MADPDDARQKIVEKLKRRPSKRDDSGSYLAQLLAFQDYMMKIHGDVDAGSVFEILEEEIKYILTYFDQVNKINRAVLVPAAYSGSFKTALKEFKEEVDDDPDLRKHPVVLSAKAREVYETNFRWEQTEDGEPDSMVESAVPEEAVVDLMINAIAQKRGTIGLSKSKPKQLTERSESYGGGLDYDELLELVADE